MKKRKPKIGDRVFVYSSHIAGTIRHVGKLKGRGGEFDSIWSDWDCQRVFMYTGWQGGGNKQEYWKYYNYTKTCIFLLPDFIQLKDWKAEKEWEEARAAERKAYNPRDMRDYDNCICKGSCRCR